MPQDEPGNNPPAKKSSSGRPSGRLRRWNAILLSPTEAESANDKCNSSPQGWNAFFQMHSILGRQQLSPNVTRLKVRAPRIAAIRQPGQFVIVRLAENAERIPLTIADADPAAGAITLVIQSVGKSTRELVALNDRFWPRAVHRRRRGHRRAAPHCAKFEPARRPRHQHHRRKVARVGDF
jgi:hypothetical protein